MQAFNLLLYAKKGTLLGVKYNYCSIDDFIHSKQVDTAYVFHDMLKRLDLKTFA